jgi:hypothetical protein
MKFILEFKSYKKPTYKVGDIVLIEYWYLDEPDASKYLHDKLPLTPVKIIEKISNISYKVTHNNEKSKIFNAPDEIIKSTDIIDHHR